MIKNFNINKNSTQYGRSMIEMLGVLAIVGVLSVGGIAGYSKAMTKFKINKIIDQVAHIATNIRTIYAQQSNFSGLDRQIASNIGAIPDSIPPYETHSNLINIFGGEIMVAGDDNEGFIINYSKLPKEVCIALATHDWGTEASAGLTAISIGDYGATGPWNTYKGNCTSAGIITSCPGDATQPTPMNISTAAYACSICANGYECTVGWRFEK